MRSFRTLYELADRFGLTLETGEQVMSLPYAEGQMLATLADDWTRARIEPQVLTLAHRSSVVAPGAGNFNYHSFEARAYPCRLVYLETGANGVCFARVNQSTLDSLANPPTLPIGIAPSVLEGPVTLAETPPSNQGGLFVRGFQVTTVLNPARFSILDAATTPNRSYLPLILLPGESLLFMNINANTSTVLQVVWQQLLTQSDVLTSQLPPTIPVP